MKAKLVVKGTLSCWFVGFWVSAVNLHLRSSEAGSSSVERWEHWHLWTECQSVNVVHREWRQLFKSSSSLHISSCLLPRYGRIWCVLVWSWLLALTAMQLVVMTTSVEAGALCVTLARPTALERLTAATLAGQNWEQHRPQRTLTSKLSKIQGGIS